eukprot:c50425_g1_i1 orf=2-286(+)
MDPDGMALYSTSDHSTFSEYWKRVADQETALINASEGPIYARMSENGYLAMYQKEDARVAFAIFATYHVDGLVRRLKLDPDGNLRVYYWQEQSW